MTRHIVVAKSALHINRLRNLCPYKTQLALTTHGPALIMMTGTFSSPVYLIILLI